MQETQGTHPPRVSERTPNGIPLELYEGGPEQGFADLPPDGPVYQNIFGEIVINRTPRTPKPPEGVIHYMRATDVPIETLQWIWEPYIPLGKLVMLDGDPGVGKSSLCAWLAGAISTGRGMPDTPDQTREPANVLMLSAEDGIGDTIIPRLKKMEADLERVFVSDDGITLNARGLTKLEKTIAFLHPKLVFIDPIVFYMGADMDMNRANEVRGMTGRLSMMAGHYGCTIIPVRHLRKQASTTAIYRGQGTIDFVGAARSVLLLERRAGGKTVMDHIKTNAGRKGETLSYTISDDGVFYWGPIVREGDSKIVRESKATVRELAVKVIRETLKDGPRPYNDVLKAALKAGLGERTIERAKIGLATSTKNGKEWTWELTPEAQAQGEKDANVVADLISTAGEEALRQALAKIGRGPIQ